MLLWWDCRVSLVWTIITCGASGRSTRSEFTRRAASEDNTHDHAHGAIGSADKGLSTRTSRDPSGPLEVPLRLVLLNFNNGNPQPNPQSFTVR